MEREIVLELFDRYADMVYRVALSYLRSPRLHRARGILKEQIGRY